jgi:hypothetical protein
MHRLLLFLALGAGLGACKGDRKQCEDACRNSATLLYWRDADAEIAKAPADKREALRKTKLGMFDSKLENGVELCISQCTSANNETQTKCMIEAKTAEQIDGCVKD